MRQLAVSNRRPVGYRIGSSFLLLVAAALQFGASTSAHAQKSRVASTSGTRPQSGGPLAPKPLSFEEERALNGPTGYLGAGSGATRILRVGTFDERHILSFGNFRLHDVMVMKREPDECCTLSVLKHGASMDTVDKSAIQQQLGPESFRAYGSLSLVVINQVTGRADQIQLAFPEGIDTIVFDHPDDWREEPLTDLRGTAYQVPAPPAPPAATGLQIPPTFTGPLWSFINADAPPERWSRYPEVAKQAYVSHNVTLMCDRPDRDCDAAFMRECLDAAAASQPERRPAFVKTIAVATNVCAIMMNKR